MDMMTEFETELKEAVNRMLKTRNHRVDAYAYVTGYLEAVVRSLAWRLQYEGKTDELTYQIRVLRNLHTEVDNV